MPDNDSEIMNQFGDGEKAEKTVSGFDYDAPWRGYETQETPEDGVKTVYKTTGLNSFGIGANIAEIDVKDGKVLRTRPLRYDNEYPADYLKPWTIKARGSEFKSGLKTYIPTFAYAYKHRIYSKNRIQIGRAHV